MGSIRTFLAAAVLVFAADAAFAFGMLGSQGAWHEKITREALQGVLEEKTLASFAGASKAAGAVGAPDLNAPMNDAQHCDNGDHFPAADYPQKAAEAQAKLRSCRAFMFERIESAVSRVAGLVTPDGKVVESEYPTYVSCVYVPDKSGRAKCDVLARLGQAVHAAQDFYSHSNWVDEPAPGENSPDNPAGLGKQGNAPFLESDAAATPPGLISGCFDKTSVVSEARGCNYGDGKKRVKHAVLNKDGPTKPRGAINGNFERARAAAAAETKRKWAYFEDRVRKTYPGKRGEVMICAMRKDDAAKCN